MDNHSFDALLFGNINTSYPLLAEGYNRLYFDYSHFGYTQINWFVYHKLYHNIYFLAYCLPNSFNEQSLVSCKASTEVTKCMQKFTFFCQMAFVMTFLTKHSLLISIIMLLMCRNPTLAKCGGEAQHLEKLEVWSPPGLPNV